jgi:hypothetical protein
MEGVGYWLPEIIFLARRKRAAISNPFFRPVKHLETLLHYTEQFLSMGKSIIVIQEFCVEGLSCNGSNVWIAHHGTTEISTSVIPCKRQLLLPFLELVRFGEGDYFF